MFCEWKWNQLFAANIAASAVLNIEINCFFVLINCVYCLIKILPFFIVFNPNVEILYKNARMNLGK